MKKVLLFLMLVSGAFAQMPNYFYTTLTATITSTDTTCAINPNDTTYFGSATNFYGTIYDTYYNSPAHARSRGGLYETVLIESRSGLNLHIVRGRLGTTARNFNVAGRTYRLEATILNDIFDSLDVTVYTDSVDAHRTVLNKLADSITAHNTRINASTQRATDSVSAHRTFINANRDSIHRLTDTTVALRASIASADYAEKFLKTYTFNEEFDAGTTTTGGYGRYRWSTLTNGTTITVSYNATAISDNNNGTIRITKSSTSGMVGIYNAVGSTILVQKYNMPNLVYKVRVSTVCADSTNKNTYHGIINNPSGAQATPSTGIYFYATDGNWQAVTRVDGSNATTTNTGVAPTVAFQTLKYTSNSDGTIIKFYIDGNLVATHNGNIPTGFGTAVNTVGSSSGSTSMTMDIDYVKIVVPGLED